MVQAHGGRRRQIHCRRRFAVWSITTDYLARLGMPAVTAVACLCPHSVWYGAVLCTARAAARPHQGSRSFVLAVPSVHRSHAPGDAVQMCNLEFAGNSVAALEGAPQKVSSA